MGNSARYRMLELTQATHRDQFYDEKNALYKQADFYEIVAHVYEGEASTALFQTVLIIDEVIFDTAQTGDEWEADDVGYNFEWTAPSYFFPKGSRLYRVVLRALVTSKSNLEATTPLKRTFWVDTGGVP